VGWWMAGSTGTINQCTVKWALSSALNSSFCYEIFLLSCKSFNIIVGEAHCWNINSQCVCSLWFVFVRIFLLGYIKMYNSVMISSNL
jgi:hypothetical protein